MNSTLQRRSNGTYVPGVSGNPRGRPPGLVAFKNLLSEKLPPEELAEILAAKCREGDTQALKFVGEPNDIANAVVYLVSDAGKYVSGAELVVDGGGQWKRGYG